MTNHDKAGPAGLPAAYVAAFNARDLDALERLYEDAGVLVPQPGSPVTGAARAAAGRHLLGYGLPIEAAVRHVYEAGDLALLVVDWVIQGDGPDGAPVRMAGTACDVARRGADGRWRYVIDNPFGGASPEESFPGDAISLPERG